MTSHNFPECQQVPRRVLNCPKPGFPYLMRIPPFKIVEKWALATVAAAVEVRSRVVFWIPPSKQMLCLNFYIRPSILARLGWKMTNQSGVSRRRSLVRPGCERLSCLLTACQWPCYSLLVGATIFPISRNTDQSNGKRLIKADYSSLLGFCATCNILKTFPQIGARVDSLCSGLLVVQLSSAHSISSRPTLLRA